MLKKDPSLLPKNMRIVKFVSTVLAIILLTPVIAVILAGHARRDIMQCYVITIQKIEKMERMVVVNQ